MPARKMYLGIKVKRRAAAFVERRMNWFVGERGWQFQSRDSTGVRVRDGIETILGFRFQPRIAILREIAVDRRDTCRQILGTKCEVLLINVLLPDRGI